uniref:ATP-binding protein n=1 Tax=Prosthecobacter sp. TaxID=1965333 RepID=UPI003784FC50
MNWRPRTAEDLIGQAWRVALAQAGKAKRLAADPSATMKLLLYGPPGVGKTSVVELVALQLAGTPLSIEDYNGREVTVDLVREWMKQLPYGSLFSSWSVKIVNELDRCSREAQDLLLTYLDRLPPGRAFLGTSNLQLDLLTERFQTRFQAIKLLPPTTEELAAFLTAHWAVPLVTANQIAVGSGGCVRAALADLESYLDHTP